MGPAPRNTPCLNTVHSCLWTLSLEGGALEHGVLSPHPAEALADVTWRSIVHAVSHLLGSASAQNSSAHSLQGQSIRFGFHLDSLRRFPPAAAPCLCGCIPPPDCGSGREMVPGVLRGLTGLPKHLTDHEAQGMCEQVEGRVSSWDAPGRPLLHS